MVDLITQKETVASEEVERAEKNMLDALHQCSEGAKKVLINHAQIAMRLFETAGVDNLGLYYLALIQKALDEIITWKFNDVKDYDKDISSKRHKESNIYGNGHILLYKEVYEAIVNHKPFSIDAPEALKSLNIVLAAYKSALTNKVIKMEDFSFDTSNMAKFSNRLKS